MICSEEQTKNQTKSSQESPGREGVIQIVIWYHPPYVAAFAGLIQQFV
jgi:hypothetical protein